jgi:Na+-translocating ferredoxin:NAD+ oxidoreductase RnfC subunit
VYGTSSDPDVTPPVITLDNFTLSLPDGKDKATVGDTITATAEVTDDRYVKYVNINLDSPVTKGCSGVTVFGGKEAHRVDMECCIKCAKCVSACPMGLEPYLISKMSKKQMWESVEAERITDCIECGCCQYTCPAGLPLLDYVRLGKQTVMGIIRARAAANAPKK